SQVLGNLLGNAIKFCHAGDTITVRGGRRDDDVELVVEDTGPGISEHDLPHIFEPYWSAMRHQKQSTGLGLYISKAIVEAHGGALAVASAPGRGASFSIMLPIAVRRH